MRGLEAEHRADRPLAQLRDERVEAWRAIKPLAERPRSSSIVMTSLKPYLEDKASC